LGIADNTMLWFTADNGPEGSTQAGNRRGMGSAGPLRGRKRSLYEGGVRVPGLLEWPAMIRKPRVLKTPCSTSDYFPTVMEALGLRMQGQPEPIDGVSMMPLIEGKMTARAVPIVFESGNQIALIDNRYKIYSKDKGENFELYDLTDDPGETNDLAGEKTEIVCQMSAALEKWRASCKNSLAGDDYI
jgi:arylsulfatase A-like enzyme